MWKILCCFCIQFTQLKLFQSLYKCHLWCYQLKMFDSMSWKILFMSCRRAGRNCAESGQLFLQPALYWSGSFCYQNWWNVSRNGRLKFSLNRSEIRMTEVWHRINQCHLQAHGQKITHLVTVPSFLVFYPYQPGGIAFPCIPSPVTPSLWVSGQWRLPISACQTYLTAERINSDMEFIPEVDESKSK